MTNIYMLLLMSVSGTIMYLLSSIFGKKMKHHIWQYAMLVTSVVMLLVPIQKILEIPRFFKVTVPQTINIADMRAVPAAAQASVSAADIITAVWIIGAVIFAVRIIFKYIKTALTLRQITEECYTSKILDVYFNVCGRLSVRRNVMLRSSKYLNSPLLFGIFRPTIIIPNKDFSAGELEMILTHELTHYKHRDLWIALAASIAQCVHWFNPVVYFIGKSITEVCELFCDETVVKRLNPADKKAYGNLILSVIERELNSRLAYTTSMASAGDSIQKRLRKIMEFKMPTKASTIAGIMAVFACVVSSVTAFGFETAAEVIPEEIKQIVPIAIPTATPSEEPIPMPAVEPEAESPKAIAMPDASGETEDYTEYQSEDFDSIPPEINRETETIQESENSEITSNIIDISQRAVGFGANFTEKGQKVESAHTFTSDTDTTVAIYASNGKISVVNADTNEVVYEGNEDDEKTARIPMTKGERWRISVTSVDDGENNANVYTYGYNDDTDNESE